MDVRGKLEVLADAAKYDASCASGGATGERDGRRLGTTERMGICHSYTPDGRCVSLLKILLTNYCIYDCHYCVNRISSDTPRARFTVDEVVWLTLEFYRRNYIEGLFLSSGIIQTPDYTMQQLVEVARRLRREHGFGGYIHLKSIPGAAEELLTDAARWADRLSVNIELPTPADMKQLAPEKTHAEIHRTMQVTHQEAETSKADQAAGFRAPPIIPAGQTTQMIVGATPTSDAQILQTARELYERFQLKRVYYTAYSPIPHADARLPGRRPPLLREHRLYQADWLIRHYGFAPEELTPVEQPDLDLNVDPKTQWALRHRDRFPVDLNKATREELLRVPGLGRKSVDRILQLRRHQKVRLTDLVRLRVSLRRARPFLILSEDPQGPQLLDRENLLQQLRTPDRQLLLFESAQAAATGEV